MLLVLGVVMFGPEKLPAMSRKLARIIYMIRVFLNKSMDSLKEELGPDYADLKLTDLNPKTFVRRTLLVDVEEDIDDLKRQFDGFRSDLAGSSLDIKHELQSATAPAALPHTQSVRPVESPATISESLPENRDPAASSSDVSSGRSVPWDDEAT